MKNKNRQTSKEKMKDLYYELNIDFLNFQFKLNPLIYLK